MGEVFLARERESGFLCALKVIRRRLLNSPYRVAQLRTEVETLRRLRHRNIVRLDCYFYDADAFYLCMEYCPRGSLDSLLSRCGPLAEAEAAPIVAQLGSAIKHLHDRRIIHRDIKPENVLLSKSWGVRLADFGLSRRLRKTASPRRTFCGTLDYLAPEVLSREGVRYTPAADMWALGALTHELLTGKAPFEEHSREATAELIRGGPPYEAPAALSPAARDFLERLLAKDQAVRMTIAQALAHPWLAAALDRASRRPPSPD